MGRFKKGLFIGSLLGAGLMWLGGTKKGKQTGKQLIDHAEKLYPDIKQAVLDSRQVQHLTKSRYIRIAKEHVDRYAKKYRLPPKIKDTMMKTVRAKWKEVQHVAQKKK